MLSIKCLLVLLTITTSIISGFELKSEDCCGTRPLRKPKIINGTTAIHGHYPWVVSLQHNNRHHCGGSLIRANWVLTAAHCVYRGNVKRFSVKLGGFFRNRPVESTSVTVNPTIIVAHSGFNFATFLDDLALVKLPQPIPYSNYIRPICLPKVLSNHLDDDKATVIGWGKLQQGGMSSNTLQEAEIPIVDNAKCSSWYREKGKSLLIRPTQICAGLEEGGKDACQGDSGSPMLVTDSLTQKSTIVGIVSAGIGCALPKLPGLYTRVSSYLKWIDQVITLYDGKPMAGNNTVSMPEEEVPESSTEIPSSTEVTSSSTGAPTSSLPETSSPEATVSTEASSSVASEASTEGVTSELASTSALKLSP